MTRTISKLGFGLAAFLALSVAVIPATAQVNPAPADGLPPLMLETFSSRPAAEVAWSKTIGQLETKTAGATLTALVLRDASTAEMLRGVRIELRHNVDDTCDFKNQAWNVMCRRPNAAVFVEEGQLEPVRNSLLVGSAAVRPCDQISLYREQDSAGVRAEGTIVCGYVFPGVQPSELSALLASAAAELEAAPR